MTAKDLKIEVIKYLQTTPEIRSCLIEISPYTITLNKVNHTDLSISSMTLTEDTQTFKSDLMQANIKESLADDVGYNLASIQLNKEKKNWLSKKQLYLKFQYNSLV